MTPRSVDALAAALIVAALALGGTAGCVTGDSIAPGDGGDVVERSKPTPPPWTAFAAGRMHESETQLSYVELGTRLRDLPLGLKQTQLQSVEASRNALVGVVKDRLEDDRDRLSPTGQADLDRRIADCTADFHAKHAKVSDIYFEKLTGDDADLREYFNAFVLVTVPRDRLPELFEALGKRFSQSGDAGVRGVGQRLLARVKAGALSH
jgi:hypothetical protein